VSSSLAQRALFGAENAGPHSIIAFMIRFTSIRRLLTLRRGRGSVVAERQDLASPATHGPDRRRGPQTIVHQRTSHTWGRPGAGSARASAATIDELQLQRLMCAEIERRLAQARREVDALHARVELLRDMHEVTQRAQADTRPER
jgi:hypothetical protein